MFVQPLQTINSLLMQKSDCLTFRLLTKKYYYFLLHNEYTQSFLKSLTMTEYSAKCPFTKCPFISNNCHQFSLQSFSHEREKYYTTKL